MVLVTTYQSCKGRVLENTPSHRYTYSATHKAQRIDSDTFAIITPAVVLANKANEYQRDDSGHYAILNQIDKRVKKGSLTKTPMKNGPGYLQDTVTYLEDVEWNNIDHFVYELQPAVIKSMQQTFKEMISADRP